MQLDPCVAELIALGAPGWFIALWLFIRQYRSRRL